MAIALSTRRAFRDVKRLQFCYLCARPLSDGSEVDDDHVPPTGLFAEADRDVPLVLPTHRTCNGGRSQEDQAIAQLVGLLHGRVHPLEHLKLQLFAGHTDAGLPLAAVSGLDLPKTIRRWVRGFHAALYGEALPTGARFVTSPPLHEAQMREGRADVPPVADVIPKFVHEIRRNRLTKTLDVIECRNGKCRYECVWATSDHGQWICIYAIDLYGWSELSDADNFGRLGCVGCYNPGSSEPPSGAAVATGLEFALEPAPSLDPF